MASTYPTSSLPPLNQLHNYVETPPDVTLMTQPSAGPPKIRRRLTAAPRIITGQLLCTLDQVSILDDFFTTTLKGGSTTLSVAHPRSSSVTIEAYMLKPVYRQQSGGKLMTVDIQLVILP